MRNRKDSFDDLVTASGMESAMDGTIHTRGIARGMRMRGIQRNFLSLYRVSIFGETVE